MAYNALIDSLAAKMAHVIAQAEGFFSEGSLPARIFNPGDMKLGDRGYGVEQGKTIYAKADLAAALYDYTDGFSALRRECTAILTGASLNFPAGTTFEMLSHKWTGEDNPGAWCKIVTENLVVDPMATIQEWIKAEQGAIDDTGTGSASA